MKNTGNKNKNTGNGTFEYIVHPDYKYSWKTFQTSFSYLYNREHGNISENKFIKY